MSRTGNRGDAISVGRRSDDLRRMHVYTPPGYAKRRKKYPVLYLLHGGGDNDDSWATIGVPRELLFDNLIAEQRRSR